MLCSGSDAQSGRRACNSLPATNAKARMLALLLYSSINRRPLPFKCTGLPGPGPALRRWVKDIGDGARALSIRSPIGSQRFDKQVQSWSCCRSEGHHSFWLIDLASPKMDDPIVAEDTDVELWELLTCHRSDTCLRGKLAVFRNWPWSNLMRLGSHRLMMLVAWQ